MKDLDFVTSPAERGVLVMEAEKLLYGDDRPKLRNTPTIAMPDPESLLAVLANANKRIVNKVLDDNQRRRAQQRDKLDYKIVPFQSADTKTTVSVTTPNESGERDTRIAHYSEKSAGGIDTQVLEVVTLKSNGQLSISTEIYSTGFDGVVNWKTSFPGENSELAKSDLQRARDLVMKAGGLDDKNS